MAGAGNRAVVAPATSPRPAAAGGRLRVGFLPSGSLRYSNHFETMESRVLDALRARIESDPRLDMVYDYRDDDGNAAGLSGVRELWTVTGQRVAERLPGLLGKLGLDVGVLGFFEDSSLDPALALTQVYTARVGERRLDVVRGDTANATPLVRQVMSRLTSGGAAAEARAGAEAVPGAPRSGRVLKVAIFPEPGVGWVTSVYDEALEQVTASVVAGIRREARMELAASAYDQSNGDSRLPEADEIWSGIADPEPRLDAVYAAGAELGVDLVVMFSIETTQGNAVSTNADTTPVHLFVIDVRDGSLKRETAPGAEIEGLVERVIAASI